MHSALSKFLIFVYIFISCLFTNFMLFFAEIDLIPAFATFLTCLFWALEYGIMVGVGIQVLVILYHAARPKVHVEHRILNGIPNR